MQIQEYLLTHTLDELATNHGVYARVSTRNPLKFSLSYDQIEATDSDPISQECRGLILATNTPVTKSQVVGATRILARPMQRFFNYGQGAAAPIDLCAADTKLLDKVDGTLCLVYFDPWLGEWCAATRSVPDADLPMDGFGAQTFSDLFWNTAAKVTGTSKEEMCKEFCVLLTYSFELCTLDNQIVVKYLIPKVFLLAVRENRTGEDFEPEEIASQLKIVGVNFPLPESYRLGSVEEMLNFVSGRDPSSFEGIVAVDKNFNRVKLKSAGYLALNKIKDSVGKSPRSVLEVILLGKEDDVFPLVSETAKNAILKVKEGLRVLLHTLDEEYARSYSEDRKTFALTIQGGSGHIGPHMSRWSGKCSSAHDWILLSKKEGSWPSSFLDNLLSMCLATYPATCKDKPTK